jgi:uncharacterized protein (TIGR04255 family)
MTHVRYQSTFLSQVILRLDYGRLVALQIDRESPFTQDMRARYPVVKSSQATQLSVTMGAQGMNVGQQGSGWMRSHATENAQRTVTLAPDFLAIEYGAGQYRDFAEFREQAAFVLQTFRKHFGAVQFNRIGLRYVNEITLNDGGPLDWDGLINSALVTSVKAGMVNGLRMTRSIHQLIAIKDDITVILNYGINNPDYPNPVARRQFILDLDCYISGLIESSDLERRISDVNTLTEVLFEHSIEDGLRSKMGIIQ